MNIEASSQPGVFTRLIKIAQEYSLPLILGVICALIVANSPAKDWHHKWFGAAHASHAPAATHQDETAHAHTTPQGSVGLEGAEQNATSPEHHSEVVTLMPFTIGGHPVTLNLIINDIFMVLFFGLAAVEIVTACSRGGSLNPIRKAINPLFSTVGGVLGPIVVFFILSYLFKSQLMAVGHLSWSDILRGWGVPTATDIALAWLVARAVFGAGHPAINFILLLAVADDAIGLVIIAVFYGDPNLPAQPLWLGLVAAGMLIAWILRLKNVRSWLPYIFIAGPLAWYGLVAAHLHAALALVFIVPFLPNNVIEGHHEHTPLQRYEHHTKVLVDFGLFFFAFANAAVSFDIIGPMTWVILGSLVIGKTLGVTLFAETGRLIGFPLPDGMRHRDVLGAGVIASLGLTVALFVADAAFTDKVLQGQAKMGALFSAGAAFIALALGIILKLKQGAGHVRATIDSD